MSKLIILQYINTKDYNIFFIKQPLGEYCTAVQPMRPMDVQEVSCGIHSAKFAEQFFVNQNLIWQNLIFNVMLPISLIMMSLQFYQGDLICLCPSYKASVG